MNDAKQNVNFFDDYMIIDFERKGNLVRFFLGNDPNYWGDDWDDHPYEHNAGQVYDEFIKAYIDIEFQFDASVLEACEDWHYSGNSDFSKEDMKRRRCPCLIVLPPSIAVSYTTSGIKYSNDYTYSEFLGSAEKSVLKIYFGDTISDLFYYDKELKNHGENIHMLASPLYDKNNKII